MHLTDAASGAQSSESQESAADELLKLSATTDIPFGARAAAALYAAVALADQDMPVTAINHLTSLLSASRTQRITNPSIRICLAAVSLQLALRCYDLGDRQEALEAARRATAYLQHKSSDKFDDFPTSPGISWGSKRVQEDIAVFLRAPALSIIATVEDPTKATWQKVVKSRSGWLATRGIIIEKNRDALVLRDEFERHIETLSKTTHFMRERAQGSAYNALLIAELSGNISSTRSARESLGKVLMLQPARTNGDAQEALRAFRRASADKPLQATLNWLRNDGPTEVLRAEAEHLLKAHEIPATRESLKVIEYAAEFLPSSTLAQAIRYSFSYSSQPRSRYRAGSAYEEAAWKTASRLVETSGAHEYIADLLLERLSSGIPVSQLVADNMALTLSRVEWSKIPDAIRARLVLWASSVDDSELESVRRVISRHASSTPPKSRSTADQIIDLVNSSDVPPDSILDKSESFIVGQIDDELRQARKGSYSFGGIPILDLGVAFAARFDRAATWAACMTALVDPNTHSMQKSAALDRLANNASKAPLEVKNGIAEKWERLVNVTSRSSLFGSSELPIDAALVRAGVALGAIPEARALELVFLLASESDAGRLEAAKTLAYLVPLNTAAAQALLMQLSRDTDPAIRAEAAYSLSSTLGATSSIQPLVVERVSELALSNGVRVSLRALHGLQFLQQSGGTLPRRLLISVRQVATSSEAARVVRGAAERVLFDVS